MHRPGTFHYVSHNTHHCTKLKTCEDFIKHDRLLNLHERAHEEFCSFNKRFLDESQAQMRLMYVISVLSIRVFMLKWRTQMH
jgi:hypothetical protein